MAHIGKCPEKWGIYHKIFMDPLTNAPFKRQAERMCSKIALLSTEFRIRQVHTRGVETKLAGIDRDPGFTVDEKAIVTDEARIHGENALIARWRDLSTLIGDHEGAALAYNDTWWSYFNINGHTSLLLLLLLLPRALSRLHIRVRHHIAHPYVQGNS